MLERLSITGVNLPRIYIAKNKHDAMLAQENGLPYIIWKHDNNELIKIILRPILEKMFPYIIWDKVLGPKRKFQTDVILVEGGKVEAESEATVNYEQETNWNLADIATEERSFSGGYDEDDVQPYHKKLPLEEYIGDANSSVDIEVLQKLQLLPKFIGDIVDCIKTNLCNVKWREGYNKKLGAAIGTFNNSKELPNLIILDVSGSIPRGIAATMISLIDTLRTQVKADLIITSDISRYYPFGSELPDAQELRDMFSWGNEARQFYNILDTHISGKEWGHVISFGDNDCPEEFNYLSDDAPFLPGTKIHCVHHFHTSYRRMTGYAKWCHDVAYLGGEEYDTSWCKIIRK